VTYEWKQFLGSVSPGSSLEVIRSSKELSHRVDDNVAIEYMYIPLIQWVSWGNRIDKTQSSPEKAKLLPFSGPLPLFLFFRFEDLPSSSLLS
jgi:hypothetical protein